MLENLKKSVFEANLDLVRQGLVVLTWGNVSAIDRETNLVVIKPSGVSYDTMTVEDMVVVDLDGNIIEGNLRPSSDTPTHLALYRAFDGIGAVVHTHSTYATAWSQACRAIPSLGTTHADTFHCDIPCTAPLSPEQIAGNYEAETGTVIIDAFKDMDPMHTPAALVAHHGPFAWGTTAKGAVQNAVVLEQVAKMATITLAVNPTVKMDKNLIEKHYSRKHGKNAYYGQK